MDTLTLNGLPAHPLVVHGAVVLVPLAAIGALVIALSATWRDRLGYVVAGLAVVGLALTWLSSETGEGLEEGVEATANRALLETHTEMGDGAAAWVLPMVALVVLLVAFAWWRRRAGRPLGGPSMRQPVALLLSLAIIASAGAATWRIVTVGHSGAASVWDGVKVSEGGPPWERGGDDPRGQDGDGDGDADGD